MHLYIDVYVPFIMLWSQKASSARSQEDPGNKAAAVSHTIRAYNGNSWTRDTAGHGSKQSCQHHLVARVSQQIMLPKRSFPFPHRKSLFQEHAPVNGLELCTLPNQLKQPFTYTPSATAYL